jgi:cell filamentation protein
VRDSRPYLRRDLRPGPGRPGPSPSQGTWFCLPQFIESATAEVFRALRGESLLRGLPRDESIERLTHYLGEINAIHPFREGNGRAQRAFFEQLADDAGFILDWQHLDADRNIAASAAIMHGDPAPMRKMLGELIRDPKATLWRTVKNCPH